MKKHKTTEVIDALIGDIEPEGASHIDAYKYQSLEDLISVLDVYIRRIEKIADQRNDARASVKAVAEKAYQFRVGLTGYDG